MIRKSDLEQAIDVALRLIFPYLRFHCPDCDKNYELEDCSKSGDLVGDVTDIVVAQLKGKGYEVEE